MLSSRNLLIRSYAYKHCQGNPTGDGNVVYRKVDEKRLNWIGGYGVGKLWLQTNGVYGPQDHEESNDRWI